METLEYLSNNIDRYLPKLKKNQLISAFTQLSITTEGKPDEICNKCKLMRWIQKDYEDIMGDEERYLEGKVKHLQDLLNFIISFTDSDGEHHKYVEQNNQGETLQHQKKTVTSPFNAEPTIQNNINLLWMVRRYQNKFMLVLQEVCTPCLK